MISEWSFDGTALLCDPGLLSCRPAAVRTPRRAANRLRTESGETEQLTTPAHYDPAKYPLL
jgi:hypothetical protein